VEGHSLIERAAAPILSTIRGVGADRMAAPTPCRGYDVRALINHLLYWGPSLEGTADKRAVAPPAASERDADLTTGDWVGRLEAQVGRLAVAWSKPEAWEGTTYMVSPPGLPAATAGGMVLVEFVVHGWDLARATDQAPSWDGEVLDFLYDEVARTAEQGREYGVYEEAVPVPDSAPTLARILGLTGRDPDWTAPRR
jgi:uncharacterized protein (TIGR03086 family)